MSREAIRARLEWLRLMGVEHLPAGKTAGPAPRAAGGAGTPSATVAAAAAIPAVADEGGSATPGRSQTALFEEIAPVPAASARRATAPRTSLRGAPTPEDAPGEAGLVAIRADLGDCRRCRLCEKRTQIVFGVGDPRAALMFIGEGPGADEDRQGEPFVGRAGQLLNRIIESIGLKREQVYIANVVKCRPPENRTPLPDETATCAPFLFRQVRAIAPRIIVCLGTPAAQTVLGTSATITRLRGGFHDLDGIKVMPTFHPAYLLRNPAAKKEVWEDMKQVMAALKAE